MALPRRFNATSYFVDRHCEQQRGEKVAIRYEDEQLSYADVRRMVNQVGNALRADGLRMEERALLMLLDSPAFVAAFFGAIKIGAVPIPLNTNLQPADYAYILNDSRARVAIVSAPLFAALAAIAEPLPFLQQIIVVGAADTSGGPAGVTVSDFDSWIAAQPAELEPAPTSADDVAFWLYTSGTTGTPKGAVHRHSDMLVCATNYAREVLGIGPDDVTFSVAKLFFAYGLGNGLYFPFAVGATTVLMPHRPEPARVFATIARQRPTLFFSAPTSYAALLAHAEQAGPAEPIDLSSLRLCVSAGEALPRPIFERWSERFGLVILDGIGSTELLHIFISNRIGQIHPGASGTPVPGYEAKLLDGEGHEVGPDQIGNLWVRGDSAATCYWNRHAQSKRTFVGDWTLTGDQYYRDGDGIYWYAGRSDDMLKVSGQWVSPFEVESALMAHSAVLEAAVVGFSNANQLTQTLAFVVMRAGQREDDAMAEDLQSFVKSRLAPYKYPRQIRFVRALPKTATGKIQRFKLRELVASSE